MKIFVIFLQKQFLVIDLSLFKNLKLKFFNWRLWCTVHSIRIHFFLPTFFCNTDVIWGKMKNAINNSFCTCMKHFIFISAAKMILKDCSLTKQKCFSILTLICFFFGLFVISSMNDENFCIDLLTDGFYLNGNLSTWKPKNCQIHSYTKK